MVADLWLTKGKKREHFRKLLSLCSSNVKIKQISKERVPGM